MNLGAFAGGAATGIMNEQHLELQKRQQDNADKAAKMADEEHQVKMDDVNAQKAARDEYAAFMKDRYGPQEVEETVHQDDGAGNMTPITVKKTVTRAPGQDLAYDAQTYARGLAIKMAHSRDINPADMYAAAQATKQAAESEEGGHLMRAIYSGNKDSLQWLGQKYGFDPSNAQIVHDDKTGNVFLQSGDKKINLNGMMAGLASSHALERQQEITKGEQGTQAFNLGQQTGKANLEQVIPAHVRQLNSAAHHADQQSDVLIPAQASYYIQRGAALGDNLKGQQFIKAVNGVIPAGEDGKPDRGAIMPIASMTSHMIGQKKMNPDIAASTAAQTWSSYLNASQGAVNELRTKDKARFDALAAQAGTKDPTEIAKRLAFANIKKSPQFSGMGSVALPTASAPTVQTRNLSDDIEP